MNSAGDILVTGIAGGVVDGQSHQGAYDVCLVKFDSSGVWQSTTLRGGSANDFAFAIKAGSGKVWIAMSAL